MQKKEYLGVIGRKAGKETFRDIFLAFVKHTYEIIAFLKTYFSYPKFA